MHTHEEQRGVEPEVGTRRPLPDEAPVEDERTPQPERAEPRVRDPGLRDLSFRDWRAIFVRAFKGFMDDNGTMLASALAYSTFFAIPAVLLVTVGVFTLVVGPDTISSLMAHFSQVMPAAATSTKAKPITATIWTAMKRFMTNFRPSLRS